MRIRMYGGVRGRKTKVGGKPTFVFLLLDFITCCKSVDYIKKGAQRKKSVDFAFYGQPPYSSRNTIETHVVFP